MRESYGCLSKSMINAYRHALDFFSEIEECYGDGGGASRRGLQTVRTYLQHGQLLLSHRSDRDRVLRVAIQAEESMFVARHACRDSAELLSEINTVARS